MLNRNRVLIVEDENIIAKDIENILVSSGYTVTGIASSANEAINILDNNESDILIIDIFLKGEIDGIELANMINGKNIPIVYITAYNDDNTLSRIKESKAAGFLIKPFEEKDLLLNIKFALSDTFDKNKPISIFSSLLDNISDGIIITDISNNVKYINNSAEHYLNLSLFESIGKNISELKTIDRKKVFLTDNPEYDTKEITNDKEKEIVYIINKKTKAIFSLPYFYELIIKINDKFEIEYVSDNSENVLKYNKNSIIKKSIYEIISFQDHNNFSTALINSRNSKQNIEITFLKKGSIKEIFDAFIQPDPSGSGYIINLLDISAWKKAENDLKDLALQLTKSNNELEQFVYIASHDLQEPLRMITSYIQLIKKKYLGKIDDDADEYIEHAVKGAMRMKQLINDLLAYSRLSVKKGQFMEINSNELIAEVESDLKNIMNDKKGIIIYDELPVITGNYDQIKKLFYNILNNSLKFIDGQPPRIVIDHMIDDKYVTFSIKDNGIGINEDFKGKVFMIFQKLHDRIEYPGTGIGLAMCKKIAENHMGHIWFNSELGKGSTFYIKLPLVNKNVCN